MARPLQGGRPVQALLAGAVLALSAAVQPAAGQGRGSISLRSPGSLQTIGQGTSVNQFDRYSYGLGSLTSAPTGPLAQQTGFALRSTITQTGMDISRRNTLSMPYSNDMLDPPRTGSTRIDRSPATLAMQASLQPRSYQLDRSVMSLPTVPGIGSNTMIGLPAGLSSGLLGELPVGVPSDLPAAVRGAALGTGAAGSISEEAGPGIGSVLAQQDETALGAARAYVQALEKAFVSQLSDRSKPLTSLVPARPSDYQLHMARGDRAFRSGNFHLAYVEFRIANDLGNRDPESFLCLTHAQFALSRYSYGTASYFLQQSLRRMPELPLANLHPRGFYGAAAKYAEHMVALQEYLERNPTDGEALLLLAYFRWFSEARDAEATEKALASAIAWAARRNDPHLAEAIETFWRGMVQTGVVSGTLKPAGLAEDQPPSPPAGKAS